MSCSARLALAVLSTFGLTLGSLTLCRRGLGRFFFHGTPNVNGDHTQVMALATHEFGQGYAVGHGHFRQVYGVTDVQGGDIHLDKFRQVFRETLDGNFRQLMRDQPTGLDARRRSILNGHR